ncbi:MAG: hypothetical protein LUG17_03030 [Clostridiales bacterium]|nr:hypothetical protein [Clostridiales bacterium]
MKKKEKKAKSGVKKPFYKKWWFWVIVVVILAAAFGGSSSSSEDQSDNTESHIYDDATVKDVMNGTHTEKLGEYSIVYIASDEATVENLTDWYYNYVEVNDYNWCMILYTDSDENKGVYGNTDIVEKDVFFEQDEYGDYSLGDSSQETYYLPIDGTLTPYDDVVSNDD